MDIHEDWEKAHQLDMMYLGEEEYNLINSDLSEVSPQIVVMTPSHSPEWSKESGKKIRKYERNKCIKENSSTRGNTGLPF